MSLHTAQWQIKSSHPLSPITPTLVFLLIYILLYNVVYEGGFWGPFITPWPFNASPTLSLMNRFNFALYEYLYKEIIMIDISCLFSQGFSWPLRFRLCSCVPHWICLWIGTSCLLTYMKDTQNFLLLGKKIDLDKPYKWTMLAVVGCGGFEIHTW